MDKRRVELAALKLAATWVEQFQSEIRIAARRLAGDSAVITTEHYQQALVIASMQLSQSVQRHFSDESHAGRQVA